MILSGSNVVRVSSKLNLPSSTNCNTVVATKVLVILPISKRSSGCKGVLSSNLETPLAANQLPNGETIATAAPGISAARVPSKAFCSCCSNSSSKVI